MGASTSSRWRNSKTSNQCLAVYFKNRYDFRCNTRAFLENVWGRPDRQTHVFSGLNIMWHNRERLVLSNDKTSFRNGFMSGSRMKEGPRSLEEDTKMVT
jgi:hypothetical protein